MNIGEEFTRLFHKADADDGSVGLQDTWVHQLAGKVSSVFRKSPESSDTAQNHSEDTLNQQSSNGFRTFTDHHQGNPDEQTALIQKLQEHPNHNYTDQMHEEQLDLTAVVCNCESTQPSTIDTLDQNISPPIQADDGDNAYESDSEEDEGPVGPPVEEASIWTRKDVDIFKESIKKEGGSGIIKVGHGETVTIRVPTLAEGTCLFWEFSTDSYDLGFGVYFEWNPNPSTQITVQVSDSEDDEEEEEEEGVKRPDIERGHHLTGDTFPLSMILPVYRRECHQEVHVGSHAFPGVGVYLLKFDNTYSLWRSKTLYYRVYYTHSN